MIAVERLMIDILTQIDQKLTARFTPTHLAVINESHLHAGHGGAAEHQAEHGESPSHIHIEIAAPILSSQSRLARHRAVMDAITDEVKLLHAIRLSFKE